MLGGKKIFLKALMIFLFVFLLSSHLTSTVFAISEGDIGIDNQIRTEEQNHTEEQDYIMKIVSAKNTNGVAEDGSAIFINGGRVYEISAKTFNSNNDFVEIEIEGKKYIAPKSDFKEIVGPEEQVILTVNTLKARYNESEAEHLFYIQPAEKYYSVCGKVMDYDYQDYLYTLCKMWGMEEYFPRLLCQYYLESKFEQDVVSHTNDYGICQLNERYHDHFKKIVGHPEWDVKKDPYANIYCGANIMRIHLNSTGWDYDIAMTYYNAGAGYYAEHGIRTQYCNAVNGFYKNNLKVVERD